MNPAISVNSLNCEYPDGNKALKNVCFEIRSGESVALMGPNGAGKTTLFLHLNGIMEGRFGRIEVLGIKMKGKSV